MLGFEWTGGLLHDSPDTFNTVILTDSQGGVLVHPA